MSQPDPDLLVRLLVKHQNALLRFIAPLVGCLDDAQEVLQSTAVALWQKAAEYDPKKPFLPWARQFAKYEVLMHHRKRRRYTFLTEELIESLIERQSEQEILAQRRREALQNCVEKLPETDRVLLRQRYAEPGTTVQQVAAESGQTANVLYKKLGHIRRQLLACVTRTLATAESF